MSAFPNKLKEAKVTPLYKGDPSKVVNYYRSISIVPVLFKVLKKYVHECPSDFLHTFRLQHKTQSGVRAAPSCETDVLHMINSWLDAIADNQMIGVELVDSKKAFDLVDHQILLSKLEMYVIKLSPPMSAVSLCYYRKSDI